MAGVIAAETSEPMPSAGDSVNSVNSVKGLGRIGKLFCDLRAAGVNVRPSAEGIELSGPTGALTPELLERLRADRDDLLALLVRSEPTAANREPAPDAAREVAGSASGREVAPSGAFRCPWCGPVDLRDDPEGLRCGRCGRLAWVLVDRSIVRADCVDDDLEGLDPDDVPTCPSCGRWCDVESITGAWRCTRCDPDAETRRRRTLRIRERVARLSSG